MAGQLQGPKGVKVISVPATEIAAEHGAKQAANTAMFGELSRPETWACHGGYGDAFRAAFAKKPKFITENLEIVEIVEVGGQAVKVLEMAAWKQPPVLFKNIL